MFDRWSRSRLEETIAISEVAIWLTSYLCYLTYLIEVRSESDSASLWLSENVCLIDEIDHFYEKQKPSLRWYLAHVISLSFDISHQSAFQIRTQRVSSSQKMYV